MTPPSFTPGVRYATATEVFRLPVRPHPLISSHCLWYTLTSGADLAMFVGLGSSGAAAVGKERSSELVQEVSDGFGSGMAGQLREPGH